MAKMTDDRLVAMIDQGINQSVGFSSSKLAKERERVVRYRDGERPRHTDGQSPYVSLDVYDGLESMKAQLLEVFSGNGRPVSCMQAQGESADTAQVRTDYLTNVLFTQNRGYKIIHDTIDDGLMNRMGIVKVWWDEKIENEQYSLSDTSADELTAHLAQNPEHDIESLTMAEDGLGIKRASLKIKKNRSQVRIRVMAPEEFGISPLAEDFESAEIVFDKQLKTASELIKEGYDKKIVQGLQDNERIWADMDEDKIARFGDTDDMIGERSLDMGSAARKRCAVYEAYLEVDMDGEGTSELWKVTKVGDVVLDKERVDRRPFLAFTPLPRTHTVWGSNYGKHLIPIQDARTHLTRSIINHAMVTNNPRLQVVRGSVLNPRELVENRFGGIVNVTRPDGILPLPQSGLNPFVFQTIAMLDADKEQVTGISRLSQGLNKDAISSQNSQGMVQELISVSQIRQKIIARNFAENFLRDLYTLMYRLVVENEDRQKIIQVAGSWVPVDFTTWPEDTELEVSFDLGYGENEKRTQKWTVLDKYLNSDPELKRMYPLEKRYNVIKKAMESSGIRTVTDYILTPAQVPAPEPDPMQQAELAMKQADAKVKLANAQAAVMKLNIDKQQADQRAQEHLQKLEQAADHAQRHDALERDKLAHKIAVDAAELRLSVEAQEQDKLTAVAQPTRG